MVIKRDVFHLVEVANPATLYEGRKIFAAVLAGFDITVIMYGLELYLCSSV